MTGRGSIADTAVVGIGQTEFSKDSGRSELRLAAEAVAAAMADAGLERGDVDGLVTFSIDTSDQIDVASALGLGELRFFASSLYGGGGAAATIQLAAMAVATGSARAVAVYRALNERSGRRFGRPSTGRRLSPAASFQAPYGLHTPAQFAALAAQRYLHRHHLGNADLAPVTVNARAHAATNPNAYFYRRPLSIADHQRSRWVVEPVLRLLDCCQESDGAVALIVTSADRARNLSSTPVRIVAAAHGAAPRAAMMTAYYGRDLATLPDLGVVARQMWASSGLSASDIDVACLYDHFTPFVLMQLEELGFCDRGAAASLVASGATGPGGSIPVNPHGGHLGEAYLHGMNGIAEAVRQIRGVAVNQLDGAEYAIATSGTGLPTSAVILGAM